MKKFAIILITLTVLIFGGGYLYLRIFLVGPYNEQSVNGELTDVSDLTINNSIGLIRIVADKHDTIRYQATKFIRVSPAQSVSSALNSIELKVSQTDSAAVIDIGYKNFRAKERKTDIEVTVPHDINVKLNSQNANIWVEGVTGSIDVQSVKTLNITMTDNTGALNIRAQESETHIYIPTTNASTIVEQDNGLLRIVVTDDKSPDLAVRMRSGKMTLTLNPTAKPAIKAVTDGMIFDTTGAEEINPTPGQGKPFLYGDTERKPDFTLFLGSADLTIELGKPVVLRARPGATIPTSEAPSH